MNIEESELMFQTPEYLALVDTKAKELTAIVHMAIGTIPNPVKGQKYAIPLSNMSAPRQLNLLCREIVNLNRVALADVVKKVSDYLAINSYVINIVPNEMYIRSVGSLVSYSLEFYIRPINDFLFELRPSPIDGIGVFAVRDFKQGELLPLFGAEYHNVFVPLTETALWSEDMKQYYRKFGIRVEQPQAGFWLPADPQHLQIGNYLNHNTTPNAEHDDDYNYFAVCDIAAGREITIDYDELGDGDNLPQ
ncbi:MAG: SET domain-containing protein [Candidatus Falkowbacteria bacterium]